MPRRDCHGRANLTALGVLTILALSGVGGFAFGKLFLGSRMRSGASEVRVPDSLVKLEPSGPTGLLPEEPRTYIRPLTGYSLTPGEDETATDARPDPLAPLESPLDEQPEPPPASSGILETPLPPGTVFIVLIGSFLEENNAIFWKDDLNNRGYRADIEKFEASGQMFFRVVVGRFKDRPAADAVAERLRNEGYTVVIVTQTPPAPAAPAAPGAPA